jgi:hypothetical protein
MGVHEVSEEEEEEELGGGGGDGRRKGREERGRVFVVPLSWSVPSSPFVGGGGINEMLEGSEGGSEEGREGGARMEEGGSRKE